MGIRQDLISARTLRTRIAGLLVVTFALRAIIPVGYMPDFGALSKGVLSVTICTTQGLKTISVDADGKTLPGKKHQDQNHPCAFAGIAQVAISVGEIALSLTSYDDAEDQIPDLAVTLPPLRAGPALGSRGPPQLS